MGKKKNIKRKKHKLHLTAYLGVAVFLVVFGTAFISFQHNSSSRIASEETPKNSLQIGFFTRSATSNLPTPTRAVINSLPTLTPTSSTNRNTPTHTPQRQATPTPGNACNHDNGELAQVNTGSTASPGETCSCPKYLMECKNETCVNIISRNNVPVNAVGCNYTHDEGYIGTYTKFQFDGLCKHKGLVPTDGIYCLGKPVIYLYPEKNTLVDVSVKTEGKIVVSDPLYPDEGWKQVLAYPNGKLEYEGNTYRELFYESETTTLNPPKRGIVLKTSDLKTSLRKYIILLGLTRKDEQQEFLDWWVPRLKALNSPYIFFSVLERNEKLRLDQVFIEPKPDTFIEFIAYFRPIEKLEKIQELQITPAPKRAGFTAVEWGGVIDTK